MSLAMDALHDLEHRIREQAKVVPVGSMAWRAHMADLAHLQLVERETRETETLQAGHAVD